MRNGKILAVVTAAVMSVCVFGGCGSNTGKSDSENKTKENNNAVLDPKDPVTVTVWHYYNGVQQTNFDEAVKQFNETVGEDKGIVVEAFSKNTISELSSGVVAAVKKEPGAENPPDIFTAYSETAYTIDKLNGLADMKKYFTDSELKEYIDEYIEEGQFSGDGTLKIFPTAKSTEIMMINATDWEKFAKATKVSVDDLKTWEGVVEVAEKYYDYTDKLTPDVKNDGKAFFGRDAVANYMNIGAKQLGAEFVSEKDGKVTVNADEKIVKKLWENYYVPYVKGYYTAQSRYRSDDAKTGSIIALICSTTGAAYYPDEVTINDDETYPIENMVLPVPNFEGTKPYLVQQGAGMSIIKSNEKEELASAEFIKWFTEDTQNIKFSVGSGYLPVKKSANDFKKISNVSKQSKDSMDDTLTKSIEVAIDEINSDKLYSAKPFEKSSEVRNYLETKIQETAQKDYEKICEKIKKGEDRKKAIDEYVSDDAFEKWYKDFKSGLDKAAK